MSRSFRGPIQSPAVHSAQSFGPTSSFMQRSPSAALGGLEGPHLATPSRSSTPGTPTSRAPEPAKASWLESSDYSKCVACIEQLVVSTEKQHSSEAVSARQSGMSDKARRSLEATHTTEQSELKLVVQAVKQRDVIGLVSLVSAFWSRKCKLSRLLAAAEERLPDTQALRAIAEALKSNLSEDPGLNRWTEEHLAALESQSYSKLCDFTSRLHDEMRAKRMELIRSDRQGPKTLSTSLLLNATEDLRVPREKFDEAVRERLKEAERLLAAIELGFEATAAARERRRGDDELEVRDLTRGGPTGRVEISFLAPPGESIATIADRFSVPAQSIVAEEQSQLASPVAVPPNSGRPLRPVDERFTTDTRLSVRVPSRCLADCLSSLRNRLELIQSTSLPLAAEYLSAAKESVWNAEVRCVSAGVLPPPDLPAHPVGSSFAQVNPDAEELLHARRNLALAEAEHALLDDVRVQLQRHADALREGDWATISYLLEAKTVEVIDGLRKDRLVFTCRPMPEDGSLEALAAQFQVAVADLQPFTDAETGQRLVYVPTLTPRVSVLAADRQLRDEIQQSQARGKGPAVDLLEQLVALRQGDAAALSQMLVALRKSGDPAVLSLEKAAMRREHSNALAAVKKETEAERERCRTLTERVAELIEKTDALESANKRLSLETGPLKVRAANAAQQLEEHEQTKAQLRRLRDELDAAQAQHRLELRDANRKEAEASKLADDRLQELDSLRQSNARLRELLEGASSEATKAELTALKARNEELQRALRAASRIVYVAKEVPPGSSADAIARSFNVPLDECFPVKTDGKFLVYVPTLLTGAADPTAADAALAALIRQLEAGSQPEIALREQLSALRSGDAASLCEMATSRFLQLKKLTDAAAARQRFGTRTSPNQEELSLLVGAAEDSVVIEDDMEDWFVVEVLRRKVQLLQEELGKSKRREEKWRLMCDEYRAERQMNLTGEEEARARADLTKRLAASDAEKHALQQENRRLEDALSELAKMRSGESSKYWDAREKWKAERAQLTSEFERMLSTERLSQERLNSQHTKQLLERDATIAQLKALLQDGTASEGSEDSFVAEPLG